MGRTLLQFGRIAPFIVFAGWLASPAFAEPRGHWRFVDDNTGIELRSCGTGAETLCAVITRLPRSAKALPPAGRADVCGLALLGDLKPAKAKDGELARLEGWVDDIESIPAGGKPPRYAARFIELSEVRARLEVLGAFGIVVDRLALTRPLTPESDCK